MCIKCLQIKCQSGPSWANQGQSGPNQGKFGPVVSSYGQLRQSWPTCAKQGKSELLGQIGTYQYQSRIIRANQGYSGFLQPIIRTNMEKCSVIMTNLC